MPLWRDFKPKLVGKGSERENKNYRFVPFRSYPTGNRKLKKNSKIILKIQKYHYGFISCQNRLGNAEKERIKIVFPFRLYPKGNKKFQKKKKKKNQKIK